MGITIYGKTKEEAKPFEDMYIFVRESLLALQSTGGFGETDFTCPLCGGKAHIERIKGEIYNKGYIECKCGCSFHF